MRGERMDRWEIVRLAVLFEGGLAAAWLAGRVSPGLAVALDEFGLLRVGDQP